MARHLMAVCVVCLLCADHLPCHQHLDAAAAALGAAAAEAPDGLSVAAQRFVNTLHLPNEPHSNHAAAAAASALSAAEDYYRDQPNEIDAYRAYTVERKARHNVRSKRHAHHGASATHAAEHAHGHDSATHDDDDVSAKSFVQKLFQRFGSAGDAAGVQTMNVVGFERMLDHLGLYEMLQGSSSGGGSAADAKSSGDHDAQVSWDCPIKICLNSN